MEASVLVTEQFRGLSPADWQVSVTTADSEAVCGFPFQLGQSYLFYVRRDGGELRTSLCSGTRTLWASSHDMHYFRSPTSDQVVTIHGVSSEEGVPWRQDNRLGVMLPRGVRGVAVTARRNGIESTTISGPDGLFQLAGLAPGQYEITAPGFTIARPYRPLTMKAGGCTLVVLSRAAAGKPPPAK